MQAAKNILLHTPLSSGFSRFTFFHLGKMVVSPRNGLCLLLFEMK